MKKIILLILILGLTTGFYYYRSNKPSSGESDGGLIAGTDTSSESARPEPADRIEIIPIAEGVTFGNLLATSGIAYALAMEIYDAAKPVYDLAKIRAGRDIKLVFDYKNDELKALIYHIDSEQELRIEKTVASSSEAITSWNASLSDIPYETRIKTGNGTIESSLYQAALDAGIDIRAVIALSDAFQWSIDFAMDPRVGDTFKFVYEERYLDDEYIMPGRVLAGRYANAGKNYDVFYFEESPDNTGYFDADGLSVQKMFLRAPVAFKYISSGYTTGPRYVAAFKEYNSSHRAVDYAAALGTPVRSVGDGTVVSAGWNSSGYGNFVSIRHNGTYTTNYGHLSKIYVSYGQKVKQDETIGAVGSTGYSTGPHLHYEMVKNGSKVNPLDEVLPPGKPIKDENRERFIDAINQWKPMIE